MAKLGFGFNTKVVTLCLSFPTHGHGPHSNTRNSSYGTLFSTFNFCTLSSTFNLITVPLFQNCSFCTLSSTFNLITVPRKSNQQQQAK
ncbi:hypothetical protein QL285_094932 [Trifolium repens]|nr:hypothetical protein QL285_094932 [Trifolium repens]